MKENEEKKKKEKAQKKLFIENPFVKKDGKIVAKPKAKHFATVKKKGWTPGSYARARAQMGARGREGGRFARCDETEDEHTEYPERKTRTQSTQHRRRDHRVHRTEDENKEYTGQKKITQSNFCCVPF